ncbi:MAG: peptidylprolyl isomerase [Polaribacter sp.]|jgi:peptidyl-prolyl cis-trans isomerase B (cyclophilin B)|nr:peptidylprolyl isomerase [Polaribacter sp.]MDG1954714.1 peptidylprolyl isomerase [Polaribacter sp.]MDG2073786.1 peptidylprolyl isomerase [Polaribacter sp.]
MKKIIYLFVVMGMISCNTEKAYNVGQIITPEGEILIWLHNETPNHKASFTQLANDGYWDNYTFNRVIPNFVAQGGCPDTPEGFTDPEYLLEPEFDEKLIHEYGAVGAGRDDNPKKLSARCQFYIVHNKKGLSRLDGDYTIFGKVIKGMDVVNAIINKERDSTNTPLSDISLDVNMIKLKASELEKLYPEGIEVQ